MGYPSCSQGIASGCDFHHGSEASTGESLRRSQRERSCLIGARAQAGRGSRKNDKDRTSTAHGAFHRGFRGAPNETGTGARNEYQRCAEKTLGEHQGAGVPRRRNKRKPRILSRRRSALSVTEVTREDEARKICRLARGLAAQRTSDLTASTTRSVPTASFTRSPSTMP